MNSILMAVLVSVSAGGTAAEMASSTREAEGWYAFDFGTATSPVAPGFRRASKETVYNRERGHGWGSPPGKPGRHLSGSNYTGPSSAVAGLFDRDRAGGRQAIATDDIRRDLVMVQGSYHSVDHNSIWYPFWKGTVYADPVNLTIT